MRARSRCAKLWADHVRTTFLDIGIAGFKLDQDDGDANVLFPDSTDFPVDAYVGPWDCANFVSDTLVALASGERCACSSAPTAAELEARAAEFGSETS